MTEQKTAFHYKWIKTQGNTCYWGSPLKIVEKMLLSIENVSISSPDHLISVQGNSLLMAKSTDGCEAWSMWQNTVYICAHFLCVINFSMGRWSCYSARYTVAPLRFLSKVARKYTMYAPFAGKYWWSEQAPTALVFYFDNLDCPPRDYEVIY